MTVIDYKIIFHKSMDKMDYDKAKKLAYWGEIERSKISNYNYNNMFYNPFLFWVKFWLSFWRNSKWE